MGNKPETALAPRAAKTDLALMESQLAGEAEKIKTLISAGGAPRITLDRSGHFTGPDGLDMGAEVRGVVVDFVRKNQFYTAAYDPSHPAPPVCFAISTIEDLDSMAPHASAPEPQWDACATCPHNQWGSRGKGKACKNTYELAFVLEEDLESENPKLYQISVPPTGMKSFAAFANLCARVLNAPPIKAIVTVRAVPQGAYTTMAFGDPDNNPHFAELFGLREEARTLITAVPDLSNYKPTPKPAAAARGNLRA